MNLQQPRSRVSSSDGSIDSSRVLIHSAGRTSEHTLPINIVSSTTRRTIDTQTNIKIQKPNPSFAETQLLSVYYPDKATPNPSTNDKCIFVEQQERQPIRYHSSYGPSSATQGVAILLNGNHEQQKSSAKELVEESKYTYEEYTVRVDEKAKQNRTASTSSSSSSVTTVIAQNEENDSDRTSRSSLDDITTNNLSTNHERQDVKTNQRISSWPPVPDDILPLDNQDEKRPTRVQFAENLVHVIPVSATSSLNDESLPPQTNLNVKQQVTNLDSPPKNQSKWVKNHMDTTDIQIKTTANHVGKLRSMFERDVSTSTTSSNQVQTDEKPSKYGTEIRFRIKDLNVHHAEPVKIISQTPLPTAENESSSSIILDHIRLIAGKHIQNLNEVGYYLQNGRHWQWNERFWLSLTTVQRDQLRELEKKITSNQTDSDLTSSSTTSSTEIKRFKSTISVTGAGAWQQHKTQTPSSGNTKYTEIHTLDESEPSINVFGVSPNSTNTKTDSQVLTSTTRSDSQVTVSESGYQSSDDRQRSRSYPKPTIEERTLHPLSYEQFICDYLSTHAKRIRSTDGSLTLFIDGQQIHMPNIRLPSSDENIILSKNIYLDAIDKYISPFETESNQLVIYLQGEAIFIPADRWLFYREKYTKAEWVHNLKRINRYIPPPLIASIEEWLSDHATISLDKRELNVDGLTIPLIGRLGLHILNSSHWDDVLTYLIRIGQVSYNSTEKSIHIAHCVLDAQRLLKSPSPELIECLVKYLHTLDDIHFHNNTLILTDGFAIPNEYLHDVPTKYEQGERLDLNQLANLLLRICHIEEDANDQSIILTFNDQILKLSYQDNHMEFLIQWLEQLNHQNLIEVTDQNDIIIYPNGKTNSQQQILIKYEHIEKYMTTENINTNDIAQILVLHKYVEYSSNKFLFSSQNIVLDINELHWLKSIIRSIQLNEQIKITEIELFDGQHTQILEISYEYMTPSTDPQIVAFYLYQNGSIRYDSTTGNYAYRYISPNYQEISPELLDLYHKTIDYMYSHGAIIYNKRSKFLQIHFFNQILTIPINELESIINKKIYHSSNDLTLPFDIQQFSQWLLKNSNQIQQSHGGRIELVYKTKLYILPLMNQPKETKHDPNLRLLFPFDDSQRSIQKTPSTTTLDIILPDESNDYAIDPLLLLANYVYRSGSIYQDELGRLVIKLGKHEIVVPRTQAISSIHEINTSPNRTGTIIARLIHRIGKVESNGAGGIIITVGRNSIELTKEIIKNKIPILPVLQHSKSADGLSSSSSLSRMGRQEFNDDQQMLYIKDGRGDSRYLNLNKSSSSVTLKPRLIIIHDKNAPTRFYIQYSYEKSSSVDNDLNSVMMLPSHYPARPTQPQLIAPRHYRNIALRNASVYVYSGNENEIYYENLAQYLTTDQTDFSSQTVRRMLKFSSRDEYYTYLNKKMSSIRAKQLVQESEESSYNYNNITPDISDDETGFDENTIRSSPSSAFYNVKNGRTITDSMLDEEYRYNSSSKYIDRSPSSSSLSSDMLITNTIASHRTILGNTQRSQYVSNQ